MMTEVMKEIIKEKTKPTHMELLLIEEFMLSLEDLSPLLENKRVEEDFPGSTIELVLWRFEDFLRNRGKKMNPTLLSLLLRTYFYVSPKEIKIQSMFFMHHHRLEDFVRTNEDSNHLPTNDYIGSEDC